MSTVGLFPGERRYVHVDTGVGTRRWPIVVPMFEQEAAAFFPELNNGH